MLIPKSTDKEMESEEVSWSMFLYQKESTQKMMETYQKVTGVNLKGLPLAKSGAIGAWK